VSAGGAVDGEGGVGWLEGRALWGAWGRGRLRGLGDVDMGGLD